MAHWLDRPKGDAAADAVKTLVVRQDRNEQSQLVDPRELPVEERLAAADEHGKKLQHIMDTVPIKIKLTQGSCAGAGSGEFHIYRKARDIERKRVAQMEKEWQVESESQQTQKRLAEMQSAIDAKAAKSRAKRQKRKGKQAEKASSTVDGAGSDGSAETRAVAHQPAAEPSKRPGIAIVDD